MGGVSGVLFVKGVGKLIYAEEPDVVLYGVCVVSLKGGVQTAVFGDAS